MQGLSRNRCSPVGYRIPRMNATSRERDLKVIATMPTVVESLTGVKISERVESMRGKSQVSGDVVLPPATNGDADPPARASKGKNPAT